MNTIEILERANELLGAELAGKDQASTPTTARISRQQCTWFGLCANGSGTRWAALRLITATPRHEHTNHTGDPLHMPSTMQLRGAY